MSIRRPVNAAIVLSGVLQWGVSAQVPAQSAAAGTGLLTTGRLIGTAAALIALIGAVAGGSALARSAVRDGRGARRGAVALAGGLVGAAGGGYVVAVAEGGPGTGYGVVGGFAALAIGLVAVVLGGLAVVRSGRAA